MFLCLNQFLGGLHIFEKKDFFFVFKKSTLQHLKKVQVQIVFNKTDVLKISKISSSKSQPKVHLMSYRK